VRFLQPADLKVVDARTIEAKGIHKPLELELPAFADDLVIQIRSPL
jgi:hypothetical protein